MSNITQSGPKGYEYQYTVSLLIALQQININQVSLYVEAVGIEDAFLRIHSNNRIQNFEIQVKSEKKLLTLPTLTKWLYHFEERGSNENLLSKIKGGSIALFVTQSRCADNIYKFRKDISDFSSHENLSIKLSERWVKDFLKYLEKNDFLKKTTPLGKNRNQLIQEQRQGFSTEKIFNKIFRNVIIWEEVIHNKLNNNIEYILNQRFHIPQSRCPEIRHLLYEQIIIGRETGNDIIPSIKQVLQHNHPARPQLNKSHINRQEEKQLIEILSNGNILLLTGSSFCGKSELAKKIASYFFDKGFNYKLANEVQLLQAFFGQNIKEDKIAILEDPWGHITPKEGSINIKRKIEQLVINLPNHHKLIISSRIEILEETFHSFPSINYNYWQDLTINHNQTLIQYWLNFAKSKNLPFSVIETVKQNLSNSGHQHQLQIGQIEHLANQEIANLENKTFNELLHIARQNVEDIGNELLRSNSQAATLLSILALCSNTIQGVRIEDLAYILLGKNDRFYSVLESTLLLKDDDEPKKIFEYDKKYELRESDEDLLDILEERGFIRITNDEVFFKHPNYYETGRYLFAKKANGKQKKFFDYYKQALGCVTYSTTHLAATQLDILINDLDNQYHNQLFELSFWLNTSVFPATKDISLIFRIKHIEKFSDKDKEKTMDEISRSDDFPIGVNWLNDIPYRNYNVKGYRFPFIKEFPNLNSKNILQKINNRKKISVKEAYVMAYHYKENSTTLVIKHLMQFNEAFIRTQATIIYFSKIVKDQDRLLIDSIFSDTHPSVVSEAIRGCFIGWCEYSNSLKSYLLDKIKVALQDKVVVIRVHNLMTTFGTDYSHIHIWGNKNEKNKPEIWNVWGTLFPIFLKQFPTNIQFHTPRFSGTMEDAANYLTLSNKLNVLNAYYDAISRDQTGSWILDSHTACIMDYVISYTKYNWAIRQHLFDKLITHQNTSFLITSISWAIDYWDRYLHPSEKRKIIDLANTDRIDNVWLQASLIILKPNQNIAQRIFNEIDFFEQNIKYIVENMSESLIRYTLQLLYGNPSELWNLPTTGSWRKFCKKLTRHILENQTIPFFHYSLNYFLRSEINGTHLFDDELKVWEIICEKYSNKDELVEYVLHWIGRCNFHFRIPKEICSILINSYQKTNNLEKIIVLLAKNVEILQFSTDETRWFQLFDTVIIHKLISYLSPDQLIIELISNYQLKNIEDRNVLNKTLIKDLKKLEGSSFRLKRTGSYINKFLDEYEINQEITTILKSFKNDVDKVGETKFKQLNIISFENEELHNWVM